jgi:hypothetical protein
MECHSEKITELIKGLQANEIKRKKLLKKADILIKENSQIKKSIVQIKKINKDFLLKIKNINPKFHKYLLQEYKDSNFSNEPTRKLVDYYRTKLKYYSKKLEEKIGYGVSKDKKKV